MKMMRNRAGENLSEPQVRSDRFFSSQGDWYFSTREGAPIGPFTAKEEARKGLVDFLEFMSLAKPNTLSRLHQALTA